MGDTLFFTADDGIHGRELWKSDGTEAGTVLVKNIRSDSDRSPGSRPRNLTVVGGRVFFTANDGVRGVELWRSDGSRAGTVMVKNIAPSERSSSPSYLTAMRGRLFFSADDGTHAEELWRSDGSRAGTVLVKNIAPRGSYYPGSYPSSLTVMGGRLFFAADDGTRGKELWRSDGSRAGTVMVKNIDPNDPGEPHYEGSRPSSLTAVGSRLFFAADDGTRAEELWRSDGSRAGTVLLKDINAGGRLSSSYPSSLTAVGHRLFFTADDGLRGEELWSSDGNRAGTALVKNIVPIDEYGADEGSYPSSLTAVEDRLFFVADDRARAQGLWRSDGNRANTVVVKTLDLNDDDGYPGALTVRGDQVFFAADDGIHGRELWRSDGSEAGTALVENIDPCDESSEYVHGSRPTSLTVVGDTLLLAADDGIHGRELWRSDGSEAGTFMIKDIRTGSTP